MIKISLTKLRYELGQKIDLTGLISGRLRVIKESSRKRYDNNEILWECLCLCGKVVDVPGNFIRKKLRLSCGCLWKPHEDEYVAKLKAKLELNSKWEEQCQIWIGPKNRAGYGKVQISNKTYILVHKLSWLIHIGKIHKSLSVYHTCGNILCIRPDHLAIK